MIFINKNLKSIIWLIFFLVVFSLLFQVQISANISELPTLQMNEGQTSIEGDNSIVDKDQESLWNDIFLKYRDVIAGASGFATLTMIAIFIINFMMLSINSDNPSEREKNKKALWITGVATICLGSITFFTGLFYNFFA